MHLNGCQVDKTLSTVSFRTCMADTGIMDLNTDFVGFWWCDLDVFKGEVLAGLPGDCGLERSVFATVDG